MTDESYSTDALPTSNRAKGRIDKELERRKPRSRFKPHAKAGMRLEERDEQLLCDLLKHRAMSRSQLQTLYFTSLVRCNARLRLLFDHRFVNRFYPPIAPFGTQAIYSVGKAALPIVARRLEIDLNEANRLARCGHTPTFIEHTLATVDIYLAFQKAIAKRDDVEMERWLPEAMCRHEWDIRASEGGKWRTETFKPDGFIRIGDRSGQFFDYFIETDLGHTSSRQFEGKLQTHQRYLESGLFRETYGGSAFKTLVITTGERRRQNLQELAHQHHNSLFWFTTFEALKGFGALSAIWCSSDNARSFALC